MFCPTVMSLRVSALVVNYDSAICSIPVWSPFRRRYCGVEGGHELIVVDNGSSDGSSAMVGAEFPEAHLIELSANSGFAGGVSVGIRQATGDWILCVNNDATVASDAIEQLLRAVESAGDEIGSAAAQMVFADEPGIINSAGIVVDKLGVASDRLLGEPVDASETTPVEVFGASGGAALYRRAMLEEVPFDESFFAYLEDVDVAWRARMRGWRSVYVPTAVVRHQHSTHRRPRLAVQVLLDRTEPNSRPCEKRDRRTADSVRRVHARLRSGLCWLRSRPGPVACSRPRSCRRIAFVARRPARRGALQRRRRPSDLPRAPGRASTCGLHGLRSRSGDRARARRAPRPWSERQLEMLGKASRPLRRRLTANRFKETYVNRALRRRDRATLYVEIGVRDGESFRLVSADRRIGIDPERWPSMARLESGEQFFEATSDEFFELHADAELAEASVDVALLDGLHELRQVLRDFDNLERFMRPDGVVIVDDCNPRSAERASDVAIGGAWNGDVWKFVAYLVAERPDLRVTTIDADQGVGVVTGFGRPKRGNRRSDDRALQVASVWSPRSGPTPDPQPAAAVEVRLSPSLSWASPAVKTSR